MFRKRKTVYYVYILNCNDNTFYTGYTNDLERRIKKHNAGKGAKYTRSRRPVELVYYEKYALKSEALTREAEIKKLTRTEKLILVENGERNEFSGLARCRSS